MDLSFSRQRSSSSTFAFSTHHQVNHLHLSIPTLKQSCLAKDPVVVPQAGQQSLPAPPHHSNKPAQHQRLPTHQRQHQVNRSRNRVLKDRECLDRLLVPLRKFPPYIMAGSDILIDSPSPAHCLSRINTDFHSQRSSNRLNPRPSLRWFLRRLIRSSPSRLANELRNQPGHLWKSNDKHPTNLRSRMRRPNYDLQEVHERKRLRFDHLWVVLGAIEGLPAGFFKVLSIKVF